MSSSPTASRKFQGAQPGNLNALKHGFYSRRFQKRELNDFDRAQFKGLEEEIALLRLFTRRVVERHTPDCDLYDTILVMRTLCFASSCLNRMLKTQRILSSKQDEVYEAFEQAMEQVAKDLGLDNDDPPSTGPSFPSSG